MKFYKSAMLLATMFLSFSGMALAGTYHGGGSYNSGCGDSGSSSLCDDPQPYSQTLYVDSFKESYSNKYYWNFDSINEPTLKISSATLEINSSSNGMYDWLYYQSGSQYYYGAALSKGTSVFTIGQSLFDEIIAGLSMKAWFSLDSEEMFWAKLTVNGEYCPPVSEVPVPAALWLFGSGLMGFTAMRRRKKSA